MAYPGLKAFVSFAKGEIRFGIHKRFQNRVEAAIKQGATQAEITDIREANEREFQVKWQLLQEFKRLDPTGYTIHTDYDPTDRCELKIPCDLVYLCYLVGHCYPWEWFSQEYLRLMDGIDHVKKRPTQAPPVQRRVSPRLTEKKRKRGITSQTNDY